MTKKTENYDLVYDVHIMRNYSKAVVNKSMAMTSTSYHQRCIITKMASLKPLISTYRKGIRK